MKTAMKWIVRLGLGALVLGVIGLGVFWYYFIPSKPGRPTHLTGTLEWREMEHDGVRRTYKLYIPEKLAEHPAVVFAFHGARSTGQRIRVGWAFGLDDRADELGALVVYPDGVEKHWNDCRGGLGSLETRQRNTDDVGYVLALADALEQEFGIDRSMIFATGFSNGGAMVYRLSRDAPGFLRAIAPVSAAQEYPGNDICDSPVRPIDIFLTAGTQDLFLPPDGGDQEWLWMNYGALHSPDVTIRQWADRDGYAGEEPRRSDLADVRTDDDTRVEVSEWDDPGKPLVRYYKVIGGGHAIPNPKMHYPRWFGATNADFFHGHAAWDFFLEVAKRGAPDAALAHSDVK